ncbi:HpcH/HpaI aldolase family protein [Yoonia sp. 208BN28-4]|uniref:HpcH/HpaI aldolase family protein n=1 Tax=Yoonia sp. 208BN28-4 TaxID=3126505 RepID=UPI003099C2D9
MPAPRNTLKAALRAGTPQYGIWLNTGSAVLAELAGQAGFDWCLIDGEHGPNSVTELVPQLQALQSTDTQAIYRIAVPEPWLIKQVLDMGCQTVMAPTVDTPEQAQALADMMRYPPLGKRGLGAAVARATGYGTQTDYLDNADDEVCLIVQIESREAVGNIEVIAAIDGVDGLFIGPADLAADMGYTRDPAHPDVQVVIHDALKRIAATGKSAGFLTFDPSTAQTFTDLGVTLMGVGGDVAIFGAALRAAKAGIA